MNTVHTLLPLRAGDLVFDIGANIGSFTSGFMYKGCRVIAVEPQLDIFEQLYFRFKRFRQVRCVRTACGDYVGSASLQLVNNTGNHTQTFVSSPYLASAPSGNEQACPMTTLEALIQTYGMPRAVKIDVEGYEPFVLKGLHRAVELITFEMHGWVPDKLEPCMTQLTRLGKYEFNFRKRGTADHLSLAEWLPTEQMTSWWMSTRFPFGDIFARLVNQ